VDEVESDEEEEEEKKKNPRMLSTVEISIRHGTLVEEEEVHPVSQSNVDPNIALFITK
jgi:hypothetical protein